jgi:hypothetical protein
MTRFGRYESRTRAEAYWLMRILDLEGCIAKTHLPGSTLRFNLELSDPIVELLDEPRSWQGVGGSYTVRLGENSGIETGKVDALPTLRAQIGGFTRMWMGAQRASALTLGGALSGPGELIRALDRAFAIPQPHTDWDF